MLPKYTFAILLALTNPAIAQGLSAADCAEIQAAYGMVPTKCRELQIQNVYPPVSQVAPASMMRPSPTQKISEPTQIMRQNSVFFTGGGAELDTNALLQIRRLAEFLNAPEMQKTCIMLTGHSDASGGSLVNMEMGAKRATSVQNRLALLLNNPARIEVVQSMGEDSPLPGLSSDSPWQRRVTIWARDCPGY